MCMRNIYFLHGIFHFETVILVQFSIYMYMCDFTTLVVLHVHIIGCMCIICLWQGDELKAGEGTCTILPPQGTSPTSTGDIPYLHRGHPLPPQGTSSTYTGDILYLHRGHPLPVRIIIHLRTGVLIRTGRGGGVGSVFLKAN